MRSIKRRHLMPLIAGLLAPGSLPQLAAAARDTNRGFFENEHLRVVRFRFEPGAMTPAHYVPRSLIVYLTDSVTKFTNRDGKIWKETARGGEVRWWPGGNVTVEILSKHRIEFVQVIPK